MIDPVQTTLLALTSHSPAAIGLVFLAGFVSSVGPCVAPRYVAIAAIVNGAQRPLLSTGAFIVGLISAFVAIGYAAGLLGALWSLSTPIYLLLAIGLIGGGCVALVRAGSGYSSERTCRHRPETHQQRSLGAIFLLGAASALVISPCCTPIVTTVVATSTAIGKPLTGVVLLLSFATGHALPLLFAGKIGSVIGPFVAPRVSAQAPAIVAAVLMLALGIYYAILA